MADTSNAIEADYGAAGLGERILAALEDAGVDTDDLTPERLAPADHVTEMFGLFALSGKVTAFLGPAVLAWVTAIFASQRAGMATVIIFIAAGMLILTTVKEPS